METRVVSPLHVDIRDLFEAGEIVIQCNASASSLTKGQFLHERADNDLLNKMYDEDSRDRCCHWVGTYLLLARLSKRRRRTIPATISVRNAKSTQFVMEEMACADKGISITLTARTLPPAAPFMLHI